LLREGAVIAQGRAPVPAGASTKLADAITAGSHAAFMTGLHTTMVVAGFVALAGAAMGPLLRPTSPRQGGQGSDDESEVAHDRRDAPTPQLKSLFPAGHSAPFDATCPTGAE
jgi:hypothetical protein